MGSIVTEEEIRGQDIRTAEIDGGQLLNRKSVYLHLEQGLANNPLGPAVICMNQPAHHLSDLFDSCSGLSRTKCNGKDEKSSPHQSNGDPLGDYLVFSYMQLHSTAQRLAAGLLANGARPTSTIIMLVPNGGEFALLLWAAVIMRLTIMCLDPSMLEQSSRMMLKNIFKTYKPSLVVVADDAGANSIDAVVQDLSAAPPLGICLDKAARNGWKSLLDLANEADKSPIEPDVLLEAARNDDPERIHSLMFTSGTSGTPKGCPLRVGGMTHMLHSQAWLINKTNCAFALQQPHNSRGIAPAQTLQTWRAGGAVVMTGNNFSVPDMMTAIRQCHVTFIVLTPAMVHEVSQELEIRSTNVDSVRSIQLGGDTITKGMLSKCAALFPSAKVCINHGMTEGGGSFVWPFFETPVSDIPYFGAICPVGSVATGSIVRIWNTRENAVAKRGKPGELHIHCGSIIQHYYAGDSEASFYDDDEKRRWFTTGDIAMINSEGLVFILGRSKDKITRGGVEIMPAVIESCVEDFTGSQACVVTGPHSKNEPEVFVVLISLNKTTKGEIKSYVRSVLGDEYVPKDILLLEELGLRNFAVNATHKIIKADLQRTVHHYLHDAKGN